MPTGFPRSIFGAVLAVISIAVAVYVVNADRTSQSRGWITLRGIRAAMVTLPVTLLAEALARIVHTFSAATCGDLRRGRLAALASPSSPDSRSSYSSTQNRFGRLASQPLATSRDEKVWNIRAGGETRLPAQSRHVRGHRRLGGVGVSGGRRIGVAGRDGVFRPSEGMKRMWALVFFAAGAAVWWYGMGWGGEGGVGWEQRRR